MLKYEVGGSSLPYLLDCKPRLIKFFFIMFAAYIQGRLTFFFAMLILKVES